VKKIQNDDFLILATQKKKFRIKNKILKWTNFNAQWSFREIHHVIFFKNPNNEAEWELVMSSSLKRSKTMFLGTIIEWT